MLFNRNFTRFDNNFTHIIYRNNFIKISKRVGEMMQPLVYYIEWP